MYTQERASTTDRLINIAKKCNGYVSAAQAIAEEIPRRCFAEAIETGVLVQVGRGLYTLPDTWEDPYFIMQHRFAKGIYSDGTALFLHGMTDRAPLKLTMTFPRNYNKTQAKEAGIFCRSCADEVLELGMIELKTMYGNSVRVYDLERTLCDLVRGQRAIDEQLVNPAMRAYVGKRDKDIPKLLDYASALGVEAKIQAYVRVLL